MWLGILKRQLASVGYLKRSWSLDAHVPLWHSSQKWPYVWIGSLGLICPQHCHHPPPLNPVSEILIQYQLQDVIQIYVNTIVVVLPAISKIYLACWYIAMYQHALILNSSRLKLWWLTMNIIDFTVDNFLPLFILPNVVVLVQINSNVHMLYSLGAVSFEWSESGSKW